MGVNEQGAIPVDTAYPYVLMVSLSSTVMSVTVSNDLPAFLI